MFIQKIIWFLVVRTPNNYVQKHTDHFSSILAANVSNFSMTAAQWDTLNQFTQHVGWELTFGLNSLLRNPYPVGVWDPKNAEELMKYSNSRGYTINWELGNGQLINNYLN